jgi:hypothetical protein
MANDTYTLCLHCSNSFEKNYDSQKFCGLSCSTKHKNTIARENKLQQYLLNPKQCLQCNSVIDYHKQTNKFCSQSCGATYSNQKKDWSKIKTGPAPIEKHPYCKIQFILCTHSNRYYSNKNPDGSTRRSSPYIKTIKEQYYFSARFKFNVYHYPEEFDLALIDRYGWYTCPGLKRKRQSKNTTGVSRDHIISVSYGFANNIDPKIIAHPANCRIMLHSENKIKHGKCDLTIEQLLKKIDIWNKKYTAQSAVLSCF